MSKLALKVTAVEELTPLVKRFRFEDPTGAPLPVFSGGAHITVEMPDGDTIRRNSYSLISDPYDPSGYEIAVRREDTGRGGSRHMHTAVAEGDTITVSVPANLFQLDLRARKHVLIGGGIGITPFLSQLRQLDRAQQPYELHYAARSRAEAAGIALLPQAAHIHVHISEEGNRMDLGAILDGHPLGTHVYTCGPEGLIAAVADQAARLGWPTSAVHSEAFTAPPPGEPFEVTIASTGQTVAVKADQSLLEALEQAGVEIDYSCRGGACGRCETAVTACDGQIEHNDHWLSADERAAQTKIMPCMSRFTGTRLELDL
ncbi:Flavodoxin reductase (ferredoxin-NADPH reductase) family 1, Vanillate O-demethylase oxidoreductase [Roseibacterium elongatum DSM 19469]|uniref:Flavodoxin reductase (Ferredoxin-NADPH reductase) family 1, Vanillate O-demethylase oxidoreductase n=1 Tax=Roseicyclus elongatus DSM 19469 TaxID=1294273 RepID=W8RWS4_9RHOB|nr:PDR/VanB family oxidoreductase [Roseibacterium elongatum]AHM05803.1 Flavodoxin reductase (ferredoxin-NADPH reductase) family 1, Vanillate O-demethylase oxidoreductase [Roseibacterium elongatum DSM 19469]